MIAKSIPVLPFVAALAISTSVANADVITEAQKILIELGYNIGPADGIAGSKTRNAIKDILKRSNINFNGQIDEETIYILEQAATNSRVDAKIVNALFNDSARHPTDIDKYRQAANAIYPRDFDSRMSMVPWTFEDCDQYLSSPHDVEHLFTHNDLMNSEDFNRDCLASASRYLEFDVIRNGKNSVVLRKFYEIWAPAAFNNLGYIRATAPNSVDVWGYYSHPYNVSITNFVMGYISFAKYYGVSAELDDAFRNWWEYFDSRWEFREDHVGYNELCLLDYDSDETPFIMYCNNNAAEAAELLSYVGLYLKDSTYLQRSLQLLDNISRFSDPGGVTPDARRSASAPGYLARTSGALSVTLHNFARHGFDLTDRKVGKSSLREIVSYGINTIMDPTVNYEYAKWQDPMYAQRGLDHTMPWFSYGPEGSNTEDPQRIAEVQNTKLRASYAFIVSNREDLLYNFEEKTMAKTFQTGADSYEFSPLNYVISYQNEE